MQFRTQLKIALFLGLGFLSSNTYAQAVEKIYAANSCDTGTDEVGMPASSNAIFFNGGGAQSITRRGSFDDDVRIICPITRQKINSASGAKFSMFVEKSGSGAINCTMTSRRPHNGALVSTGSRGVTAGSPAGEYRLVRSIAPSSTFGPYSLVCDLEGFPNMFSYIIREF